MTTTPAAKPEAAGRVAPANRGPLPSMVLSWPGTRALIAVVLLFAVSPLIAPASVGGTAIISMLPFAALIAIVAIGQTFVIQQGGLDLSLPGAVTLGALLVSTLGSDPRVGLTMAIIIAIVATSLFGLLSGVVIAFFGLPPLVVTIATNALMVGAVQSISGGFSGQSDPELSAFAISKFLGIPVLAVFAIVIVVVVQAVLKFTRLGRRFELVGENQRSAEIIGIPVRRYVISAYWLAGALAAGAGVLLAGLLRTPTLTAGNAYLLPSIAAVVLGGTALTGGRGSLAGTAFGALFLAQLTQLVQTFTTLTAVQNIVQALIIGVGIVAQLQLGGSSARLKRLARRSTSTQPTKKTQKRGV
ncbi:ABC transporter permease [Lacisediminihabitans profunda]|uniref:ABC transporter permease n=1 Tax=Lacisediminihabitans profunda TaxID=2594790 RepID=A0A5C8UPE6_9MICO|nr:ABC transporter permease [Lacisediminihabitans profunda]TXN29376.1 ABC transporter permease [Lacisediminihabitans profunda]